jgi:uncharacterized membrane protein (DUF485 family)
MTVPTPARSLEHTSQKDGQMADNDIDFDKMWDRAWSYFERHAEQRIKMFNYYVLLCAAITAGLVAATNGRSIANGWPLGFLLAMISFVFWKLDVRSCELKDHSEEALKMLEDRLPLPDDNGLPNRLKLFRREEAESTMRKKNGRRFPYSRASFTDCFNWIFVVFGFCGLVVGIFPAAPAAFAVCQALRGFVGF